MVLIKGEMHRWILREFIGYTSTGWGRIITIFVDPALEFTRHLNSLFKACHVPLAFYNMMLSRVLLWILLAFFIYKFVFDFLAPLIKVSVRMRRQMKDFQRQHQQQQEPFQQHTNGSSSKNNTSGTKPKAGEYIDFEEIKDK